MSTKAGMRWSVPTSFWARMMLTIAMFLALLCIISLNFSSSTYPAPFTGTMMWFPDPAASSAVLRTLLCSTELVTMIVRPVVLRILVITPLMAMLALSVPELVK
jgi:hypothetical protein